LFKTLTCECATDHTDDGRPGKSLTATYIVVQ
jgi:hypothetical protein